MSDLDLRKPSAASKFRNKKVTVDNIEFDSKKEAEIYLQLKTLKQAGEIVEIEMQKRFELIPAQYEDRQVRLKTKTKTVKRMVERAIVYVADFVVHHADGDVTVVDCKGWRTEVYRIKKKLMLMVHGIRIKEM